MKKIVALLLAVAMCVSLIACSGNKDGTIAMEYAEIGETKVHSISAKKQANGDVNCTLEYTAPADRNISVFNPPEGDLFMFMFDEKTTGDKGALEFTIESEHIEKLTEITVNFYPDSGDANDCIVLRFAPEA